MLLFRFSKFCRISILRAPLRHVMNWHSNCASAFKTAVRKVTNIIYLHRTNTNSNAPAESVKIIISFYRAPIDKNILSRYQMLKVNNVRFVLRNFKNAWRNRNVNRDIAKENVTLSNEIIVIITYDTKRKRYNNYLINIIFKKIWQIIQYMIYNV